MVFGHLDDERTAIHQTARRFAEARIAPYAAPWDETGPFRLTNCRGS